MYFDMQNFRWGTGYKVSCKLGLGTAKATTKAVKENLTGTSLLYFKAQKKESPCCETLTLYITAAFLQIP